MEERCTRHTGLPTERVRCSQGTCTQHVYHDPVLLWTCTRPMAPHLTGPSCSLTTAKCSVAPKSAEPQNHAHAGQQASGCKARWVGYLGTQRSLNTPHPPSWPGMQTLSQGLAKCMAGPGDLVAAMEADALRAGRRSVHPSPSLLLILPHLSGRTWDRGLACPWLQPWLESEGQEGGAHHQGA